MIRLLEISTLEYVPAATRIMSALAALVIAPLMVKQGAAGELQEFELLPIRETYKAPLVKIKLTEPGKPVTVAVTLYVPTCELDVKIEEIAAPSSLEVTVMLFVPVSLNVPLGPEAGAANVTSCPLTGLPDSSTT